MFCKWCGGNLASSDTKCKRCGKEVPALSDCGGFYDLLPNVNKPVEVHAEPVEPSEKPVNPSRKPEPSEEVSATQNKKSGKKRLPAIFVLTVIGFALALLLLALILGKVNQYSSEVNRLRNDLRIIITKIDAIQAATEPVETEPEITEPTVVLDPVLADQNVVFSVTIPSEEPAQKIDADLHLGDYTDVAIITYGLDELTGAVNSAGYSLEEANTTVSLTIDYNIEVQSRSVFVAYVIDDTIYGLPEAPETFKWQYRFDPDSDWEDLSEDVFVQTDSTGKTGVTIIDTALQTLIADNEGQLELRCEIYRTNTDDGSLTIVIEGIRFCDEENDEDQTVG